MDFIPHSESENAGYTLKPPTVHVVRHHVNRGTQVGAHLMVSRYCTPNIVSTFGGCPALVQWQESIFVSKR